MSLQKQRKNDFTVLSCQLALFTNHKPLTVNTITNTRLLGILYSIIIIYYLLNSKVLLVLDSSPRTHCSRDEITRVLVDCVYDDANALSLYYSCVAFVIMNKLSLASSISWRVYS